jgi:hypothetical protein
MIPSPLARRAATTRWLAPWAALAAGPALAATWVVPTDFPTIQNAIDAASTSDDVLVEPGTYRENLILRSSIEVRGREAARTVLEPQNDTLPTVRINLGDDIRFSNFTLIGARTGIEINVSTDVLISNVVFEAADERAVEVDATSTVEIRNSVFAGNEVAIRRGTSNVGIVNNIFSGNETTVTSLNPLLDNDDNVAANCWFSNSDTGQNDGYGTGVVGGDPLFVDTARGDYHLRVSSPCIDIGQGTDVIDDTAADAGVYGGPLADVRPFPLPAPTLSDTSAGGVASLSVQWPANTSYLVASYGVHYAQSPPGGPYDGSDAGGGAQPSPVDAGNATSFTLTELAPSPPPVGATLLLAATGASQSVTLIWQAVAGATGYRIHHGIASTDEQQTAVGNVTTHTVGGLANGSTYRFAVSAEARATYRVAVTARDSTASQHESPIVAETPLAVGDPSVGARSNELTALPQFVAAYPLLPDGGGGCFIATAAYGADWQAEVQILRDFRDRYLVTHEPGRQLVALYYRHSPALAAWLAERDGWRAVVRLLLTPFVAAALLLVGSGAAAKTALLGTLAALALLVRRRRGALQ